VSERCSRENSLRNGEKYSATTPPTNTSSVAIFSPLREIMGRSVYLNAGFRPQ
jgi:hypothetical protein